MVVWEGTRPLLVEIQALVDHSMMANPRRVAVGLEQNRLAILLAVLHRHGGLQMADQDVFVNVFCTCDLPFPCQPSWRLNKVFT
ncbi:hypothetical protein BK361_24155 [Escherichia coli]|nr:hypothetical protein BK361_24155 [Escherichia coli]